MSRVPRNTKRNSCNWWVINRGQRGMMTPGDIIDCSWRGGYYGMLSTELWNFNRLVEQILSWCFYCGQFLFILFSQSIIYIVILNYNILLDNEYLRTSEVLDCEQWDNEESLEVILWILLVVFLLQNLI